MKSKKPRKVSELTDEEIMKRFDGEVVANETEDAEDIKTGRVFDDAILDKRIIVFGVKEIGKRMTDFGNEVTDYDITCRTEHGEDYVVRTNHRYCDLRLIPALLRTKKPIKCIIFKAKSGKYYLKQWSEQPELEEVDTPF